MPFSIAKRELLSHVLEKTGGHWLLELAGAWTGLVVLNYHRIGDPGASPFDHGLWSATEEDFDAQVAHLKAQNDVIGLDDLDEAVRDKNGRYVMLTFDDGYRDNFTSAFSILKSRGVPATFFITTGFLDEPRVPWWDEIAWMVRSSTRGRIDANVWTIQPVEFDRPTCFQAVRRLLRTYKQLAGHETGRYLDFLAEATGSGRCRAEAAADLWMTWGMVREMRRAGMSIGGHTVTHPVLSNLPPEEQHREIGRCQTRLESQLGEPITGFSFPVGDPGTFDEFTRACLVDHGCRWAFSYYGGYNRFESFDRYDIRRFAVERDLTRSHFRSVVTLPQVFTAR